MRCVAVALDLEQASDDGQRRDEGDRDRDARQRVGDVGAYEGEGPTMPVASAASRSMSRGLMRPCTWELAR